jgi:uncharacterized protein with PIN domain
MPPLHASYSPLLRVTAAGPATIPLLKVRESMTEAVEKHFVVDSMLGKLATWLRILGFDTLYERLHSWEQIETYRTQGFLLITRNRRWSGQTRIFCLTANDPLEQLRAITVLVPVTSKEIRLLQRCVRCNELLQETAREQAFGQVPDYIFAIHISFHRCPNCRRLYWPGSHSERIMQRLQQKLGWSIPIEAPEGDPRANS